MINHCVCCLLLCFFAFCNGQEEPKVPHLRVGPFDFISDGFTSPPPEEPDQPEGILFQQDIKIAGKFIGQAGTARAPWPNAVIPYVFDCSVGGYFTRSCLFVDLRVCQGSVHKQVKRNLTIQYPPVWTSLSQYHTVKKNDNYPTAIEATKAAMREWESKTCIRFVKKRPEHKAYLELFRSSGCWATFVGYRKGTKTQISIGNGCDFKHVMVHELGHVIGFWHEQSRTDRDRYVTILLQNVIPALRYNFDIVKEQTNHFGESYDFSSIMHYPWTAFASQRGLNTIRPRIRTKEVPYVRLSRSDAQQAKTMYKCSGVTASRGVAESTMKAVMAESRTSRMSSRNCEDAPICKEVSHLDYCETIPNPMLMLCPKSCSNCGPCVDHFSNCEAWAYYGYCDKHPVFMLRKCKLSCAICAEPTTSPPTTTKEPTTTRPPKITRPPRPTKKPTTAPTVNPNVRKPTKKFTGVRCVDRSASCKRWQEVGRCVTDIWVKRNCLLSCKRYDICDVEEIKPIGSCTSPLGVGWDGKISDQNFYGTSIFLPGGGWKASAHAARLYRTDDHNSKIIGSWCPSPRSNDQYLSINLERSYYITAIATQGRDTYFEHVKAYYLSMSYDGRNWREYMENGRRKVFDGNCDNITPVLNILRKRQVARHIRFHPLKYSGAACLRVEVYGCKY